MGVAVRCGGEWENTHDTVWGKGLVGGEGGQAGRRDWRCALEERCMKKVIVP